jgi:hypothetical protein
MRQSSPDRGRPKRRETRTREILSVIHRCCCGLDVHKETVVACLLKITAEGELRQETRTFRTFLGDLQALGGWLREEGCSHAAMESESTGVVWRPVHTSWPMAI